MSYRYVGTGANQKYVHRVRAEKALGKPLPAGAEVHHADGSKRDDAPLVICQDRAYHQLLHARMRVVKAGGNPNTDRICATCRRLVSVTQFRKDRNECRECQLFRNRGMSSEQIRLQRPWVVA